MTVWTPEEDAVIRDNPCKSNREIAILLPDRDRVSVQHRRSRLHLTKTRPGSIKQIGTVWPRDWSAGGRDERAGAAVFRAGVE